jgi:hypothetical protein
MGIMTKRTMSSRGLMLCAIAASVSLAGCVDDAIYLKPQLPIVQETVNAIMKEDENCDNSSGGSGGGTKVLNDSGDEKHALSTQSLFGYIDVKHCWDAEPDNDKIRYLNDLYTQVVIQQPLPKTPQSQTYQRDYDAEGDSRLERLVAGGESEIAIQADIIFSPETLKPKHSVLLAMLNKSSGASIGQKFVTRLRIDSVASPLIRINPNTTIELNVTAKKTVTPTAGGAAFVIGILETALKAVAPSSALLTEANKGRFVAAGQAMETAFIALTKSSIEESASFQRLMSEWYKGASVYLVSNIPVVTSGGETPTVVSGVWRIALACPRPSAFDTRNICDKWSYTNVTRGPERESAKDKPPGDDSQPGVRGETFKIVVKDILSRVTPEQILGYKIDDNQTVQNWVVSQKWFAPAMKLLAQDGVKAIDAGAFCSTMTTDLYQQGFTTLDAGLILWAFVQADPNVMVHKAKLARSKTCASKFDMFDGEFGARRVGRGRKGGT